MVREARFQTVRELLASIFLTKVDIFHAQAQTFEQA
jgi:hypothetical protein